MWVVGTLWGADYKIENSHTDVAYCCIIATTRKWDYVSLFLESKKKKKFDSSALVYICLHSITESSTLVYTRLVARLHSFSDLSTVVYICLWLVYIRLVTCLCFLW